MDAREVAQGLTEAQRDWIKAMPTIPVSITPDDWDAMPDLFVQFEPDEFCPETGIYLGGGDRHWFASAGAHYYGDGGPWFFDARLNDTGLAVRAHLLGEG